MDTDRLRACCDALPLFPLPGVVFLPHSLLPLHVFEPRYRALVADVMRGERVMAVPMLAEGWEEAYEGRAPIHPVAGVGRIVRHEPLPEGRSNVVLAGLGRVRVEHELDPPTEYRQVRATLLADQLPEGGLPALKAAIAPLRVLFAQLVAMAPGLAEFSRTLELEDPVELVDALAHMFLRQPGERQAYLELDAVTRRAERVSEAMAGLLLEATRS